MATDTEVYLVSQTDNITTSVELPLDMRFNDGHRMAIILYLGLMPISATGNIFVLISLMRLRKIGKLGRINLLLLNLVIADLMVTFIMMPLEIFWNSTVSWRAGDFMCRLLSFFRVFGLYLSGFVIICICLDRYYAIIKPFANCEALSRDKKLLCGAWIASIFCSLPQSFIFHVERHPHFTWYEQCITFNSFPSPDYELAYNLFGFCMMYTLPMATILFCYSCILCKIYSINATGRNGDQLRRSSVTIIERAKMKTLKMTVITALAFSICWSPYNIISLWYWCDKSSAMRLDQRLQKGLFVFACTNSCVNPLIYGWYHLAATTTGQSDIQRKRSDCYYTRSQYIQRRHEITIEMEEMYKTNSNNNVVSKVCHQHHQKHTSFRITTNPSYALPSPLLLNDHKYPSNNNKRKDGQNVMTLMAVYDDRRKKTVSFSGEKIQLLHGES